MKKFEARALKGLAYSASALAMVVAVPAYAQDAEVDCDNLDTTLPVPPECQSLIRN